MTSFRPIGAASAAENIFFAKQSHLACVFQSGFNKVPNRAKPAHHLAGPP
jgi:hypothetical protein